LGNGLSEHEKGGGIELAEGEVEIRLVLRAEDVEVHGPETESSDDGERG
jgi:hypothetical protein